MHAIPQIVVATWLAVTPVDATYQVELVVTSELPPGRVPMDPMIDFTEIAAKAKLPGVLDPNSIEVIDTATQQPVPCSLDEEFNYGDRGRVRWVIEQPDHKKYQIRFHMAAKRPARQPKEYAPLIGTGDLLRYNAGAPRPITLAYFGRLVDLTGDGRCDLVGCWNYSREPEAPWDGVVCYPRLGDDKRFEFGDMVRIRYLNKSDATEFKHFRDAYMFVDVADFNGDKLPDLVHCSNRNDQLAFYLNSGKRDAGGMPIFVADGSVSRQTNQWEPTRAVDLNGDGAIDFVVDKLYLKNTNPKGWPVQLAKAVALDVGRGTCFFDVDGDGRLDAVSVLVGTAAGPDPDASRIDPPHTEDGLGGGPVVWRRNLGGDPPRFAPPQRVAGVDAARCTVLAAVDDGERRGLLVQHNAFQNVSFYEQQTTPEGKRLFQRFGRAESPSAVIGLSDQCWPYFCDWDGDGDLDLLTGDGYGWPKILINHGTRDKPAFDEAQPILSEGKPIRLLRNQILGSKHWHNMGYLYPAFVDWDADGLPDLVLPNETNRIFWYKNVGSRAEPKFGPQQQIICDGFPDSPERRAATAKLTEQPDAVYPPEKDQPFAWRTGAALADYNGDGLMDMITADSQTRQAVLFVQYRDAKGTLRLKRDRELKLPDGHPIDETAVGRSNHWTDSYRAVDWDGDGLVDLVYSCAGAPSQGSIFLLRNVGSKEKPNFGPPRPFCCFGKPIIVTLHGPHPWLGDLDGDGQADLVPCVEWSVYPFYRHAAIEMKERPRFELSGVKKVNAK
jgi:hypothetical protein